MSAQNSQAIIKNIGILCLMLQVIVQGSSLIYQVPDRVSYPAFASDYVISTGQMAEQRY